MMHGWIPPNPAHPDELVVPTNTWTCGSCGRTCKRYRGESDVTCRCGAEYNASGQRLRDDWRGNPSNWDEDISDLDGFEMQHTGDDA